MTDSMNRTMVRTIVKKAIRDIRTDPERTTRNLVDMALNFADSRFQKQFYSNAQSLLSNEKSGYYALVRDTLTQVDEETLLTFGMDLGYNGLYEGARMIRRTEAEEDFNVPWTITLTIPKGKVFEHHHQAIEQGEDMGIHTWQLFSRDGLYECMVLAEQHPDSAFVIFCNAGEISWNLLDYADDIRNIALVVSCDGDTEIVCEMLRASRLLYGVCYTYTENDLPAIESGALLHELEKLAPAFAVLKPQFSCQREVQERVYRWITEARLEQEFHTIIWELYRDVLLVDKVISDDPCWVGFDEYDQLYTQNGIDRTHGQNIYLNDLKTVLKRAFPKK